MFARTIQGGLRVLLAEVYSLNPALNSASLTINETAFALSVTVDAKGEPIIDIPSSVVASFGVHNISEISFIFNISTSYRPNYVAETFSDPSR